MADETTTTTPNKQLVLQKIYIKDFSFESPKAPAVFTTNVSPQTQLNIRSGNQDIGNDNFEVTLTLTVDTKEKDETLFLIEIVQAGVFQLSGYTAEERDMLIGSFCPSTLYPFAREAIADIANKGGFPQLLLQPINFDALYAQALQQRQQQAADGAPASEQAATTTLQQPSSNAGETH